MNGTQHSSRWRLRQATAAPARAQGILLAVLLGASSAASVLALPPAGPDPGSLMASGQPVASIPTADRAHGFQALDDAHVVLSVSGGEHYLLTLSEQCFGLRWARHVGVTASDNTIWAGFDALTADGEACPIQAIHLVPEPAR